MSDKIEQIIEALRKKILESAIRGELVPQNPDDEPASVLLERIAEEREKLIREKKIKKPKTTSRIFRRDGHFYESINGGEPTCIDDDIPFDIPDSWEWVRLGEIVEVLDSQRKPITKRDRKNGAIPYYGATGILDYVKEWIFDEPLLLLGEDGAKWGAGDNSAYLIEGKSWVNNHAHVFKVYSEIELEWLKIVLNSLDLAEHVTGTTVPKLNQAKAICILVPIPPIAIQKKILAALNAQMRNLANLEESRKRYKRILSETPTSLRQQLIQSAIHGQLAPQNPNDEPASVLLERIAQERSAKLGKKAAKSMSRIERRGSKTYIEISPEGKEKDISKEIPFDIPQNWEWGRLEQIGNAYIGLTYSPSDIREKGTAVLRANNIQNGKISYDEVLHVETDIPERAYINKGDLLICARNGSKNLVGKTAIVERNGDAYGAFMAKFVSVSSQYLYYFFSSQFFREQLDDANTTTIYQVTQSMLKRLLCPIPPAAEQVRIYDRLGLLLKTLDNSRGQ